MWRPRAVPNPAAVPRAAVPRAPAAHVPPWFPASSLLPARSSQHLKRSGDVPGSVPSLGEGVCLCHPWHRFPNAQKRKHFHTQKGPFLITSEQRRPRITLLKADKRRLWLEARGEMCLFATSREPSQGPALAPRISSHSVQIAAWVAHVVLSANSSEPGSGSERKLCQNPITSSRKIQPGGIRRAWRIAGGKPQQQNSAES